eukprot:gnl/MRDRNA2_/MRDRNA2_60034_c0_seq1.p1 gnl/MRDRNA2_/MRDRNA2_60034_c0~~gnl/MRDRNA2_/MRDRNA2_60034_c0_seq1.p1  ORF type:complete len:162 (+),score=25.55 gnl/MRDRNA2_/MRDRNA2_60034_c0_seq1:646-1131(+)
MSRSESCGELEKNVETCPQNSLVFSALRATILCRIREFAPNDLFSVCWAYSTVGLFDKVMQAQITHAILALGYAREGQVVTKEKASTLITSAILKNTGPKEEKYAAKPAFPYVLGEGLHWFALYKPPLWQMSEGDNPVEDDNSVEDILGCNRSEPVPTLRM